VTASPPALLLRDAGGWRTLTRAELDARVRELAHGMVEAGLPAGGVVALEHAADGDALLVAIAALEAGAVVALGPAVPPFDVVLAADPARAAACAAAAGVGDPLALSAVAADAGRSLERLAAHGVVRRALRPEELADRARLRRGGDAAVRGADGATVALGRLHAGVGTLRAVGDLLRPGETMLAARPIDRPWVLALALAALEASAPVAVGGIADAAAVRAGPIATTAEEAEALAAAMPVSPGPLERRMRAASLRLQRGDRARLAVLRAARVLLGGGARPPARCLVVDDRLVPRDACTRLHGAGATVLHAAADDRLAAPVLLNRPHRYRFDALGLPLPGHRAAIEEGELVVRGPAAPEGGPLRTGLLVREGPDGFLAPVR
jgi:hypothetical protein